MCLRPLFTKAAQQLHIAQPSLSMALDKLGKELGVALFLGEDAHRRNARLTEAGRLLLQDARTLLDQAEVTAAHMRQFSQRDWAEVRLAYTAALAERTVPALLHDFLTGRGKGCTIYSDEMPTDRIAAGLRDGRFDLGLGSVLPPEDALEQIPFAWQPLCLLTPPGDSAAYDSPAALNGAPLITFRQDYPMARLLAERFAAWGCTPHPVHYAYSEASIARLVAEGLGIAVVAETDGMFGCPVRRLRPAWLTGGRHLYLIRHRTRLVSTAARALQALVLERAEIR